jgi:hypothetical protein
MEEEFRHLVDEQDDGDGAFVLEEPSDVRGDSPIETPPTYCGSLS